jgi:hypothetical protein
MLILTWHDCVMMGVYIYERERGRDGERERGREGERERRRDWRERR